MTASSTSVQPNAATPLSLTCQQRIEETHDTATLCFTTDDKRAIDYKPGQFISLGVDINGKRHHRAYTLSSTPSRPQHLAVTVKRVKDGLVSNHLLDTVTPGVSLQALSPAGEFYLKEAPTMPESNPRELLFVSAGSGITPVMSMSRYLLDNQLNDGQALVNIHFIHCARTIEDVIFLDELQQMNTNFTNFRLSLVLSDIEHPNHRFGFLNHAILQELAPTLDNYSVYTCGPQPFMTMLSDSLKARKFNMDRFFQESFSNPIMESSDTDSDKTHKISVPAFNKFVDAASGSTLLDSLEKGGLPIVAACRAGVCGSCKCKVTSGEVDTSAQMVLSDADKAAGYVLACSTKVKSDIEVELG